MPKTLVSGAEIVTDAKRYLGIPYVWGGGPDNPRAGLDCSGLVERVAFDVGINDCPRTSEEQWTWSRHLSTPDAGDLVFFVGGDGEPGNPGHVGIVVTPGTMIDAPTTGEVVQQSGYSNGTGPNEIVGYGRMRGANGGSANQSYISATTGTDTSGSSGGAIAGVFGFLGIALFFGVIIILLAFGAYLLIM